MKHWPHSKLKVATALLAASFALSNPTYAQSKAEGVEEQPDTYEYSSDKVRSAIAEARKSLGHFTDRFDAAENGSDQAYDFRVKVALPLNSGRYAYVWLDVLSHNNESILTFINVAPFDSKIDFATGDNIQVQGSEVLDWSYAFRGVEYGHFTTRVITHEPGFKELIMDGLSPEPLPSDWPSPT